MELGRKIRVRREARGLTQAELARMAGISQGHLANLEAGRRTPRLAVLERLARALEISPGELMAVDGSGLPRRVKCKGGGTVFVPAAKVKKRLKVVVYGEPGTGKTHFALTFPDPAVVDSEGGTDFFAGRVDFRVWKTKSFSDLMTACEMVESGRVRCGTLVIDSITVFCDVLREAAFRVAEARARARGRDAADAALTVRDWGQVKMHIRSLLTRLYNLPCHTVITGWIKDEYEDRPDGRSIKVGQVLDGDRKILYQPDVVLRMEVRDGRYCAVVEKDRSGRHPRGAVLVNPSYADLAPAEDGEAAPAAPMPDESAAAEADAALFRTGPEQLRATAAAKGLTADELAVLVRRKFGAPPEELTPEQIEEAAAGIAGADAEELKRAAARLLRGGAA